MLKKEIKTSQVLNKLQHFHRMQNQHLKQFIVVINQNQTNEIKEIVSLIHNKCFQIFIQQDLQPCIYIQHIPLSYHGMLYLLNCYVKSNLFRNS